MNVILKGLDEAKRIAIFGHIVPDADALCSSIALKKIIKKNYEDKGSKIIDLFFDGEIGDLYDHILRDEAINPKPLDRYDIAIVLDCPKISRVGKYEDLVRSIPQVFNIDHHETNQKFGTYNCVASKCSSTSEIVYSIAKANGLKITDEVAKFLYQGILTDTNCFTSHSMQKRQYAVVSELLEYDFNAQAIQDYYKKVSKAKMAMKQMALENREYFADDKLLISQLAYDCLKSSGAKYEDTFGIVDELKKSGAIVSVLLTESKPNDIYVSMRSDGKINIGEIAVEFGGGGGEKMAAYQTHGDMEEAKADLVSRLTPVLEPFSMEDDQEPLLT